MASCWPLEKIQVRLGQLGLLTPTTTKAEDQKQKEEQPKKSAALKEKKLVVLLTTGAMNPVHNGHIKMLEKTADALTALDEDFVVLGGFISPSHDLYLQGKFGTKPCTNYLTSTASTPPEKCWATAKERIRLAEAAVQSHPFISVGKWECSVSGRWPDFPEVALELAQELNQRAFASSGSSKVPPITVMYCCGEDHYTKCGLSRGLHPYGKKGEGGIGVCVISRGGKKVENNQNPSAKKSTGGDLVQVVPAEVISAEHLVFAVNVEDECSDASSTKVRKMLHELQGLIPMNMVQKMFVSGNSS